MNRKAKTALLILGFALLASPVWAATDYSSMSNEELSAQRGNMGQAGQEEKEAFRNEWQNRVGNMSQEERQNFNARSESARDGSGNQYGRGGSGDSSGRGYGSGGGQGSGKGRGHGGGNGRGRGK